MINIYKQIKKSCDYLINNISSLIDDKFIYGLDQLDINIPNEKELYYQLKIKATPFPWFFKDNNDCYNSPQVDFFSFYILRISFRSFINSIEMLKSAELCFDKGYLSSTISLSYASSFHSVIGLCSLFGHLFIDPSFGQLYVVKDGKNLGAKFKSIDDKKNILATLTKSNNLNFTKIPRNHNIIWNYFKNLLSKNFIDKINYKDFFDYLFKSDINYYLGNLDDSEIINYVIKKISKERHKALYQGCSYDNYLLSEIRGDKEIKLNKKAEYFLKFADKNFCILKNNLISLVDYLNINFPKNKSGANFWKLVQISILEFPVISFIIYKTDDDLPNSIKINEFNKIIGSVLFGFDKYLNKE